MCDPLSKGTLTSSGHTIETESGIGILFDAFRQCFEIDIGTNIRRVVGFRQGFWCTLGYLGIALCFEGIVKNIFKCLVSILDRFDAFYHLGGTRHQCRSDRLIFGDPLYGFFAEYLPGLFFDDLSAFGLGWYGDLDTHIKSSYQCRVHRRNIVGDPDRGDLVVFKDTVHPAFVVLLFGSEKAHKVITTDDIFDLVEHQHHFIVGKETLPYLVGFEPSVARDRFVILISVAHFIDAYL